MSKKSKKSDADYEVGYGKPPKATQFKKGQSGNKKGRPKKSRNFTTLLTEELDEVMTIREGNIKKRITARQLMAKTVVRAAINGDVRQQQFVAKHDDGADEPEPFRVTEEDEAEFAAMLAEYSKEAKDENQSD
jgi:hypothetical protein